MLRSVLSKRWLRPWRGIGLSSLIYGVNPVLEALKSRQRKPLEVLLVRDAHSPRLAAVRQAADRRHVAVRVVNRQELDSLAEGGRHQGVALKVEGQALVALEDLLERWRGGGGDGLFLVLDGITDPHNLGALARSAEAVGCHGLVLPKDRSCPITAIAEKASAGALAHLPVCRVTNVARALEEFKQAGFWVYGLAGDAGSQNLYEVDLRGNIVLVVGSEGKGLRENVRSHCDALLAIPMQGQVASLNASVAGGVALFEVLRQKMV